MNSWWGIQTFKNQIRRLSYRHRRFLFSHVHINTLCSLCFQLNQLKIDSSHNHPLHPHHHCHHHHHQALSSACLSVTLCFFLNWCQIVISIFICGSSHLFFFTISISTYMWKQLCLLLNQQLNWIPHCFVWYFSPLCQIL